MKESCVCVRVHTPYMYIVQRTCFHFFLKKKANILCLYVVWCDDDDDDDANDQRYMAVFTFYYYYYDYFLVPYNVCVLG